MAQSPHIRYRPWAAGAAIIGASLLALYVGTMMSEANNSFFEILPWALLMAVAPIVALISLRVSNPRIARNLLIGAAFISALLGLVSLLTIGLGFLIAATAAAVGAAKVSPMVGGAD